MLLLLGAQEKEEGKWTKGPFERLLKIKCNVVLLCLLLLNDIYLKIDLIYSCSFFFLSLSLFPFFFEFGLKWGKNVNNLVVICTGSDLEKSLTGVNLNFK